MKNVRNRLVRTSVWSIGCLALMAGIIGGTAWAHHDTPEIDPGSMVNALLVLSGGLLIVTGRRSRK
jgi:uncharacterized membrane protein